MNLNIENCIKNQKDLDIQSEVFTLKGEELKNKLQLLLESKMKSLERNKGWMEEGYVTSQILNSIRSLEEQIAIMTAE